MWGEGEGGHRGKGHVGHRGCRMLDQTIHLVVSSRAVLIFLCMKIWKIRWGGVLSATPKYAQMWLSGHFLNLLNTKKAFSKHFQYP